MATSGTIHCVDLREGNYRVRVDECCNNDAKLIFPIKDEIIFVCHAVSYFVEWPSHLIIPYDSNLLPKKTKKQKRNSSPIPNAPMTQDKSHPSQRLPSQNEVVSSKASASILFKIPSGVPHSLKCLLTTVKYVEPSFMVKVPMDFEILGHENDLYISQEDIVHFGLMEEIGASCISLYIRILYFQLVKREISHFFRFVEPIWLSNVGSTEEERVEWISKRMIDSNPGQMWLFSYHKGNHWMLIIMDFDHQLCYFLDSLDNFPPDEIKSLISRVFQHFRTNNAKTKEVAWRTVKCPRQPSKSVQCGFYVMRMMKDFVTNEFSMRWLTSKCGGKNSYTKDEINEVREEWAQCVMDLMSTT
ncbi:uncharacterized protein LOC133822239 [Humulus lupulus]|uniref:uncharacterized protein LOC133822239 n=1 Tax=Humulus lupulus TaxID=3486 RepID=UPI002B40AAF0|nr:uncharacterized protein LOC133822239 [Humulus lupulus]XP_062110491.1 uncharacterized protein LOC133822239 [Humulus lupulus]